MRIKLLLLSFCVLLLSCGQESNLNDKKEILKLIRQTVPNKIASPPLPQNDYQQRANGNKGNDSINFVYAINSKYFLVNEDVEFSKKSWKTKNSENRFGKTEINSVYFKTLKGLLDFNEEVVIEEGIIGSLFNENSLILNQKFINHEEKKAYGIDGIISFTNINFNTKNTIAVIGLGVYRDRLDSYFNLYILEKVDGIWNIKFYKTKSYS